MRKISNAELKEIVELHQKWLKSELGGQKANLSEADLSGADLSGANLSWANLSWANLKGANLRRANLRWADLSDANLSAADLRWADFSEIKGFECVCFIISTSCRNRLVNYIPSLDVITAGCFQGTLEEFKKQVEETHKDNEFVLNRYRRVIAFMEQEKKFDDERV